MLIELFNGIRSALADNIVQDRQESTHCDFRIGEVRHIQADVTKANSFLDYMPPFQYLSRYLSSNAWYVSSLNLKI